MQVREVKQLCEYLKVLFPFPEGSTFRGAHAVMIAGDGPHEGRLLFQVWVFNPENILADPVGWQIAFDEQDDTNDIFTELLHSKATIDASVKEYFKELKKEILNEQTTPGLDGTHYTCKH